MFENYSTREFISAMSEIRLFDMDSAEVFFEKVLRHLTVAITERKENSGVEAPDDVMELLHDFIMFCFLDLTEGAKEERIVVGKYRQEIHRLLSSEIVLKNCRILGDEQVNVLRIWSSNVSLP